MWSPDLATSMLWHVLPWQCYDREIKVFVTNDDDVVVSCGLSRPNDKKSRISRCTTCEVLTLTTSSSGPPTLARKTWQKKRVKSEKKDEYFFNLCDNSICASSCSSILGCPSAAFKPAHRCSFFPLYLPFNEILPNIYVNGPLCGKWNLCVICHINVLPPRQLPVSK